MLEKVLSILADQLKIGIDDISLDSNITSDLKADSLDIVELTVKFENEFGVSIGDEEIMEIKTVEDILKYLSEYDAKVRKSDVREIEQLKLVSEEDK